MRLVDCFTGLMAYASFAVKQAEKGSLTYEQLRKDVENLLEFSDRSRVSWGCSDTDYDLARFAVVAWVDETVLCSVWEGRERWEHEQLQRAYYDTTNAGEEFFDKLDEIDTENHQVLEVYAACLAMGFAGRYYSVRSRPDLEETTGKVVAMVTEGLPDPFEAEEKKFFPPAYLEAKERARKRLTFGSYPFLIAVAIVAAGIGGALYWWFSTGLSNLVETYFMSGT